MTLKTLFLISPAWLVPPISTSRRARSSRMKVLLWVPSRAGSAWSGAAVVRMAAGAWERWLRGRESVPRAGAGRSGKRAGRSGRRSDEDQPLRCTPAGEDAVPAYSR